LSVVETLIKEGLETTLAPRFTPQPKTGNHYLKMVQRNENKKKKVRRCQECIKTKNVRKLTSTAQHAPVNQDSVYPCFKNYRE